jgi:prepilin-type N-terminal cleavage/methylation domain-containing protein
MGVMFVAKLMKKKGFTILELLIALAIAASILAIIFPFFLNNQKILGDTTKSSQLQMDTQLIMESITKSAMEASKISSISSKDSAVNTSNLDSVYATIELGNIVFAIDNTDDSGNKSFNYQYAYRIADGKLLYTDAKVTDKLIGENIKFIKVTPLDGKSFGQCAGIKIEIQLALAGIKDYNTWSNVYFRNK